MKLNIATLVLSVVVAGVGYMAVSAYRDELSTYATQVERQGRYQCAMISQYSTQDESGATVTYPVESIYQKCLEENGLAVQ